MKELRNVTKEEFLRDIVPLARPVVLRGFGSKWELVKKAAESTEAVCDYLKSFDRGEPAELMLGKPEIKGRFFYSDDMKGFNFERTKTTLSKALDRIHKHTGDQQPPAIFAGSVPVNQCLPGLHEQLNSDLLDTRVGPRIWLGNRITVQTHYDRDSNIACVAAGRRRFTLFPPSQIHNLYSGPLDFTPAGQPISMARLHDPDFAKFPRFKQALEAAEFAELDAGDAIYIPDLWWHHVESLEDFNVLVNFWWPGSQVVPDSAQTCMLHGLMSMRSLPEPVRMAWREMFDYYVFQSKGDPMAHLEPDQRGVLGEFTPKTYASIKRSFVAQLQSEQPLKKQ